MALADDAAKLTKVAVRLNGPLGNRANTRALLVEPMLAALGWDVSDVEQVLRDWPLKNGNAISYALQIDETVAMYVEARGLSEELSDELMTQTLVELEQEDVRWCLLTNGLSFKVLAAGRATGGEGRMLFEAELSALTEGRETPTTNMQLLRRDSLVRGEIDRIGDQLFTDPRVHGAVIDLSRKPNDAFLRVIGEAIGDPPLSLEQITASLERLFPLDADAPGPRSAERTQGRLAPIDHAPSAAASSDHPSSAPGKDSESHSKHAERAAARPVREPVGPVASSAAEGAVAARRAPAPAATTTATPADRRPGVAADEERVTVARDQFASASRPLVAYLADYPAHVVDIFHRLDAFATALGTDVSREPREDYIEYVRDRKPCFTIEAYHHRVVIHLWLGAAAVQAWWWSQNASRHMIDIRDRASGGAEYSVTDAAQIDDAQELMKLAYRGFDASGQPA